MGLASLRVTSIWVKVLLIDTRYWRHVKRGAYFLGHFLICLFFLNELPKNPQNNLIHVSNSHVNFLMHIYCIICRILSL